MEIHRASASFDTPKNSKGYKVLGFKKGDRFEVLESAESRKNKIWWGVRWLPDSFRIDAVTNEIPEEQEIIGYVPASYLNFEQFIKPRRLSDKQKLRRLSCLDRLAIMAKTQDPVNDDMMLPPPDYEGAGPSALLLQCGSAPPPARSPSPAVRTPSPSVNSPKLAPKVCSSPKRSPVLARNPDLEYLTASPRAAGIDPRYLEDRSDPSELVQPKKVHNPCLDSRDHKDLHRELKFNQKRGIDVLHQKSELEKAMMERRDAEKKKIAESQEKGKRSSFQIQLEKQAEKIKEMELVHQKSAEEDAKPEAEFLKAHARINKAQPNS